MNKEPNAFEALFYWLLVNYQTIFAATVYAASLFFILAVMTQSIRV